MQKDFKGRLHPIMFAGTGSDVGKSVIATAFCRIFREDGYNPAPFKAQNMALNSYATKDGFEIGRAQAVQAEAAKVDAHTDMNPLLLKPTSNMQAQIVLNGKPIGNRSAYDYFQKKGHAKLKLEVFSAFDRLEKRFNPIVLEGAGSISEINLRDRDLVNMPMAIHAKADVILVADIDRGGVFASLYGSVLLLTEEERKHLKGIIINKFRGDIRLFESGVKMIEDLCKVPVLGVVPYYRDISIEAEDSVILDKQNNKSAFGKINVAVVLLDHMANFTDFSALANDKRVNLYYTHKPKELRKADIVIVPGSKNTIYDMIKMRERGLGEAILEHYKSEKLVIGICGGYQMLGLTIHDPDGEESECKVVDGLGIIPVDTIVTNDKITRQISFHFGDNTTDICKGYEIHQGRTVLRDYSLVKNDNSDIFTLANKLEDDTYEGIWQKSRCLGTYIHGILDNKSIIDQLLRPYLKNQNDTFNDSVDYQSFKERQYDALAQHVRESINMDLLYQILSD